MCTFENRDARLKELGFESYADYLQSDLWAWIRSRLMEERQSQSCVVCGSKTGLCWHHTSYAIPVLAGNFSNEMGAVIVRLCVECHKGVHIANGVWQTLSASQCRLMEMAKLGADWRIRGGVLTTDSSLGSGPTDFDEYK